MTVDFLIIGGGIVGASTAWQLQQRFPEKSILLVEKESSAAQHQTGHNSGVIHAGVYYAPGSLKAQFCRDGLAATVQFCQDHNIAYEQCGKLLVATDDLEVERMQALYERCQTNNIDVELLDQEQLKTIEPAVNGLGAIKVAATGIVDYQQVTAKMLEQFQALGGKVRFNHCVNAMHESDNAITLSVTDTENNQKKNLQAKFVISCSGLMADRVTNMLNIKTDFKIIPFRGEYYQLNKKHNTLVKHLIYPIPDPELPFLGVHLTRMIDGSITVGPNAVQGWKREGYGKINISLKDCFTMFSFSGFWKVLKKHFKTGLLETRDSWWKMGYLKRVKKYCSHIHLNDLEPYPAGVRAQAVMADGSLVHDFLFAESPRSLHVCNAPSPAATSAIPIGDFICDKVSDKVSEEITDKVESH